MKDGCDPPPFHYNMATDLLLAPRRGAAVNADLSRWADEQREHALSTLFAMPPDHECGNCSTLEEHLAAAFPALVRQPDFRMAMDEWKKAHAADTPNAPHLALQLGNMLDTAADSRRSTRTAAGDRFNIDVAERMATAARYTLRLQAGDKIIETAPLPSQKTDTDAVTSAVVHDPDRPWLSHVLLVADHRVFKLQRRRGGVALHFINSMKVDVQAQFGEGGSSRVLGPESPEMNMTSAVRALKRVLKEGTPASWRYMDLGALPGAQAIDGFLHEADVIDDLGTTVRARWGVVETVWRLFAQNPLDDGNPRAEWMLSDVAVRLYSAHLLGGTLRTQYVQWWGEVTVAGKVMPTRLRVVPTLDVLGAVAVAVFFDYTDGFPVVPEQTVFVDVYARGGAPGAGQDQRIAVFTTALDGSRIYNARGVDVGEANLYFAVDNADYDAIQAAGRAVDRNPWALALGESKPLGGAQWVLVRGDDGVYRVDHIAGLRVNARLLEQMLQEATRVHGVEGGPVFSEGFVQRVGDAVAVGHWHRLIVPRGVSNNGVYRALK